MALFRCTCACRTRPSADPADTACRRSVLTATPAASSPKLASTDASIARTGNTRSVSHHQPPDSLPRPLPSPNSPSPPPPPSASQSSTGQASCSPCLGGARSCKPTTGKPAALALPCRSGHGSSPAALAAAAQARRRASARHYGEVSTAEARADAAAARAAAAGPACEACAPGRFQALQTFASGGGRGGAGALRLSAICTACAAGGFQAAAAQNSCAACAAGRWGRGVAWCGVVGRGVAWCGVVWRGVAWCGVA
jgi:hypothetical protein